jgi:hypothetical protein
MKKRASNENAGFLEGLADGRQRQRAGAGFAHLPQQALADVRLEITADFHPRIARIDATAGEDVFVRHEGHAAVPLTHQHARGIGTAPHQHERCGILGTQPVADDDLVLFESFQRFCHAGRYSCGMARARMASLSMAALLAP